ncbi:MAG: hypothetical protein H3C31_13245, partial [Brumimicrobium sp.]|nr:hypothetical protein [Brumimicrobium sp.]
MLFFILVISIFQFNLEAQSSFYYTDGSKFKIIEYFINTGSLDLSYPLIKPYDINELKRELKQVNRQSRYYELLSDDLNSYKTGTEEVQSVFLKGEVKVNFESGQITKSRNGFKISANYPVGNFALKTSFQFDQNFKDDPTYSGELGEWYYGRFDEGYVNYSDTSLGVYAAYGRVQRNLGFYSSHSLILSDNPYSYDHLWLQYKNDLFSFSSIFARLEDKYGYDNRVKDSSSYGWYKRFFSLHRLDVNLTNNFKLALTEVVLYGGKNQQLLSYYLNPLVPFYISKTNERRSTDESDANIYLALDLWYKPFKNLTLYSQVFIDDIDFKAENRAKFPERKAIYGNVTVTDFVVPFSQFGVSYTWVENWTYTSFYTWAN